MTVPLKRPPYREGTRKELLGAACWVREELRKYRIENDDEFREALAFLQTEEKDRYDRVTAELADLRARQRRLLLDFYAGYRKHLVDQERQ